MAEPNKTTHTDDLSNPNHPLHAGQTQTAEPTRPVATEVRSDRPTTKKAKASKPAKAKKTAKAQTPATDPDTGEQKMPRSVVPGRYKTEYAAEGKQGTCGDKIGLTLKSFTFKKDSEGRDSIDMNALLDVARANNIDVAKYKGLNNGMVRMNISNKLRGLVRHGETVVIGKQKFKNPAKVLDKAGAHQAAA